MTQSMNSPQIPCQWCLFHPDESLITIFFKLKLLYDVQFNLTSLMFVLRYAILTVDIS